MSKALKLRRALFKGVFGFFVRIKLSFCFPYASAKLHLETETAEIPHNKHINQRPQHREQADRNNPAHLKFRGLVPVNDKNHQKRSQNAHTFPYQRIITPKPYEAAKQRKRLQHYHQNDNQRTAEYHLKYGVKQSSHFSSFLRRITAFGHLCPESLPTQRRHRLSSVKPLYFQ